MWTPTTRQQHSRPITRYQTDLTDAEWRVNRAALAEVLRDGPAARVADARDHQWHLLCHAGGLPVAPAAEGLAAMGGRFTAGSPPGATTGALSG
jgi:hypothetical protein